MRHIVFLLPWLFPYFQNPSSPDFCQSHRYSIDYTTTDTSQKHTFEVSIMKGSLQTGKVYELSLFPGKGKPVCELYPQGMLKRSSAEEEGDRWGTPCSKAPLELCFSFSLPLSLHSQAARAPFRSSSSPSPLNTSPSTHTMSSTSKPLGLYSPRGLQSRSEGKNKVKSVGREQGVSG